MSSSSDQASEIQQSNLFPAALYTAIYQHVVSQEHVSELTVEDPAEAFEDLRDRNDLKILLGLKQFMEEGFGTGGSSRGGVGPIRRTKSSSGAGKMGPPVNKAWAEKWRVQLKIAGVWVRGSPGFSISDLPVSIASILPAGGDVATAQFRSIGRQGLQSV